MSNHDGIGGALRELFNQIWVLAASGFAGAAFKATISPEQNWRRRLLQFAGGFLCAVCLGGLVGHFIDSSAGGGVWAYSAAGFLMGSGGEAAVKAIQDRVFGAGK